MVRARLTVSTRLRIAYLINSLEGGGAQMLLPRVITALERHGAVVQVFALARKDGKAIPRLQACGIEPQVYTGGLSNHIGAYRWALKAVRNFSPDAIVTSLTRATLFGQQIGRTLGVPVTSWQHSADGKPWNKRLLRARRAASTFWIADSESVAEFVRSRFSVPASDIVTWPLFVATGEGRVPKPWAPPQPVQIGSIGRLHASKGYDVLIAALAQLKKQSDALPPFSVEIAGTGPEELRLRHMAEQMELTCLTFSGHVADPRKFLTKLHLYVQPSRREGFCIAAHEAMEAGVPVVASDVGELPCSVIEGETGWLVPAHDSSALAAGLRAMLLRAPYLAQMGNSGRQRVIKTYTQKRFDNAAGEVMKRLHDARRLVS